MPPRAAFIAASTWSSGPDNSAHSRVAASASAAVESREGVLTGVGVTGVGVELADGRVGVAGAARSGEASPHPAELRVNINKASTVLTLRPPFAARRRSM